MYRNVKDTDVFFDKENATSDNTIAPAVCIGDRGVTQMGDSFTTGLLIAALDMVGSTAVKIVLVDGGCLLLVNSQDPKTAVLVAPRIETDPTPIFISLDDYRLEISMVEKKEDELDVMKMREEAHKRLSEYRSQEENEE